GAPLFYPISFSHKKVYTTSMYKLSEEPPIVKLVTMLLANAATISASDVHIEPGEKSVQVRYRIDGILKAAVKYPKHIHDSVVSRVKIISNLDITNRRLPQDGRSKLRFENRDIDLRVSTMPSFYGENIVIRLLDSATGLIPLGKLGIPEHILKPLIDVFSQPQGMLLVTGPTGSGKTTTLYAILRQLNEEESHIVTIEEPIEYQLAGITQVGVNEAFGLSFPNVLRSTLRQDPDIIMVGEVRDFETAKIVVRAALTGHLVLSTLHTNDTVATVTRLLDSGLDPYLISSSVSGILAQRLLRRICPDCKAESDPPADLTRWELPPIETFYKGTGCKKCMHTGYKGRIGVYEFLLMNTNLRRLIARRGTADELWDAAREDSMITLFEDAISKVKEGIATFDEAISNIPYAHADARKEEKGS
ncbi:MAG: GspE/PulE family protein, partial [Thermodesulfovibrionales bacterium]|nr:GspE/PulE family protein [Thermodesulfovibrionales bacterium]